MAVAPITSLLVALAGPAASVRQVGLSFETEVRQETKSTRFTAPEMDDESSNTSTTTTPEPVPVCCGYRKAPARRLSGEVRYFTDFKKKAAGKTCESRSFSRSFKGIEAVTVDMECCAGLEEGESHQVGTSPCLSTGAYACEYWGAEKASDTMCRCPLETTCVQTQTRPEHERVPEKATCAGEFNVRDQYLYGLQCLAASDFNCAARGARESDHDGYCKCSSKKACVGDMCKERDGMIQFELADAFVAGAAGGLDSRARKRLGLDYGVGCISFECADFNAEGRSNKCRCPEGCELLEGGQASEYNGNTFDVQEAWDFNYWCREIPKRCPKGSFNTVGMPGRPEDELWCECSYRSEGVLGCTSEGDCVENDRRWAFKQSCEDCACE